MNTIDQLQFRGLIANKPWSQISEAEFQTALKQNGWKMVGHFLHQIRLRGQRHMARTPRELARRLRDGESEVEGGGCVRRYLPGGAAYVVYREANRGLITFRDSRG